MKNRELTKKDIRIIKFIWRWKVQTTSCIAHFFYSDSSPKAAYERLRKLKRANYLSLSVCKNNDIRLWSLTKKSFQIIKKIYPEMKQQGFKSESPAHDIKANLVQIGIFDSFERKKIKVITEQELRRLDSKWFHKSVPTAGHRPDGYWSISNGSEKRLIALELELSSKNKLQYTEIGYFYDLEDNIESVVWVYDDVPLARKICRVMNAISDGKEHKNSFINLSEFKKSNAEAVIRMGANRGQKLSSIFESKGAIRVSGTGGDPLTQSLSDTRLRG